MKQVEESNRDLLEAEIREYNKYGWRVISQTATGIQVEKKKRWSRLGLFFFVLLPILGSCAFPGFFIFAVIGLLIVVLDYTAKRDKLEYITIKQLEEEIRQDERKRQQAAQRKRQIVKVLTGFIRKTEDMLRGNMERSHLRILLVGAALVGLIWGCVVLLLLLPT